MAISQGCEIATRRGPFPWPTAIGMEQQVAITAVHEFKAQAGKPDRLVAQFVRCPFAGGHAPEMEKRFGDLAIAGLLKPCVKRAKCEDQAVAALLRKRCRIGTGIAVVQRAP